MKENVMLAKQHIPWPDDTAKRLAQIVSANGKEIYLDVDKLSGELKKSGEDTVKMMQLMFHEKNAKNTKVYTKYAKLFTKNTKRYAKNTNLYVA